MFRCPDHISDKLAELDKNTDAGDVKVWKANKKYKDACNKLEYITLRLTQISPDDLKFAMVDYSRHRASVKADHLKLKYEQAKEEVARLTRSKLEILVAVYRDPNNFLDGIPYLD